MALTPLDIHHKEFRSARFGGYNEEEVDSFLDLVADELERLMQEDSDVRNQMEQMRVRLAEFEDMQSSLQSALLAATKSAEIVREQARQESEAMIAKAQEEADSLVRSAQEQARQMTLRAQNERQKLERSFTQLKQIKRKYLQSIRELADANLVQVADLEARDEADTLIEEPYTPEAAVSVPEVQPPPLIEAEASAEATPVEQEEEVVTDEEMPAPEPPRPPEPKAISQERPAPPQVPSAVPPPAVNVPVAERAVDAPPAEATVSTMEPPVERPAPPSSNLVEEVLAMDKGEDIYEGFEDDSSGSAEEPGRRNRREKKEKHFFWE